MSTVTEWKERLEDNGFQHAETSEYFSIHYIKVAVDCDSERTESALGFVDWCHEDYVSLLDIIGMGKALGLEDDEYSYYWKLDTVGAPLTELVRDTDVLKMAQSVGRSRIVIVEATFMLPQPVEVQPSGSVLLLKDVEEEGTGAAEGLEEETTGIEEGNEVDDGGVIEVEEKTDDAHGLDETTIDELEEEKAYDLGAQNKEDAENLACGKNDVQEEHEVEQDNGVEQENDADDEETDDDLHDSDYSFNADEEIEHDETEAEDANDGQDNEVASGTVIGPRNEEKEAEDANDGQDNEVPSGAIIEARKEETDAAHGLADCPSSDYGDSDQLDSCSDSDNGGASKHRYPDFMEDNMRNPKLEVGMKFSSFDQFKEACRNYGIQNRYVIKFRPNDKKRCKAKCSKNCPFYIWASLVSADDPTIQIKSGVLTHTCSRDHNIRHVNFKWLAKEYLEQFRADPCWKLEGIIQAVRSNQKVEITKIVAYRAKRRALELINGDEEDQIRLLYDYRLELLRTHPSSTIMFKQEKGVFRGMYVCLAPLRDGFKDGCRNVICVDGCWLKGLYGMQLLSAVGIDANDCIYPFAWAVVDRENKENWKWFLEFIGRDMGINNSSEWTFMSDRPKGLIAAIDELFPDAVNRYCVRHILTNFRTRFKGNTLKDALWRCDRAGYEVQFKQEMEVLAGMSKEGHAFLADINPTHWTRAYFDEKFKCDMLLNNMCECFNSFILDSRTKGFITMNEIIRTLLMKRIQKKRSVMLKTEEVYCPKIRKKLEKAKQTSWYYKADWAGGDKYQVIGLDGQFVVDKKERSCTCRRWKLTGIPCHHAIASMNVNNENPELYLHACYKVETYLRIYSHFLQPTNGKQMWPREDMPPILPPPPVNLKRGKRSLLRRREADETNRGGQGPRVDPNAPVRIRRGGGKLTCGRCGAQGHNIRRCKGKSVQLDGNAPPGPAATPLGILFLATLENEETEHEDDSTTVLCTAAANEDDSTTAQKEVMTQTHIQEVIADVITQGPSSQKLTPEDDPVLGKWKSLSQIVTDAPKGTGSNTQKPGSKMKGLHHLLRKKEQLQLKHHPHLLQKPKPQGPLTLIQKIKKRQGKERVRGGRNECVKLFTFCIKRSKVLLG